MAPNPRILIFTETFHPITGGGETQACLLAENLAKNGFEAIVLTRRVRLSHKEVERFGGFIVYRLPPVGTNQVDKWGLVLSSMSALFRLRREYDLIFVSGFRRVGISAVLIGKLLGKPCVLKADSLGEMSGDYFSGGLNKVGLDLRSFLFRFMLWLRNLVLRKATAFVAISSEVVRELEDRGIRNKNLFRIPNGVDTARFCPVGESQKQNVRRKLGIPQNKKIVLFTGRLVSYKGLPLLLRVWDEIQSAHDQSMLLLVGSGGLDIHNCESELREFVEANKLFNSVWFMGSVGNVNEYLQASDIFVFPTEREAFGISLIEAMACGIPVVATNVGGLKDIVTDRKNGLTVESGNFQQLYDGLDDLLSDAALAESLARAGRQTVLERYSVQCVTQRYVAMFAKVLNDKPVVETEKVYRINGDQDLNL